MHMISLKYHLWWFQIFNFATTAAHLLFLHEHDDTCHCHPIYYLLTHDKFSGAVLWLVLFTR